MALYKIPQLKQLNSQTNEIKQLRNRQKNRRKFSLEGVRIVSERDILHFKHQKNGFQLFDIAHFVPNHVQNETKIRKSKQLTRTAHCNNLQHPKDD